MPPLGMEALMAYLVLMASAQGLRHELVVVSENSSVFIGCNLNNEDIRWVRNGVDLLPEELFFHVVDDKEDKEEDDDKEKDVLNHFRLVSRFLPKSGHHVLRIQRVTQTDSGQYYCRPSLIDDINNDDDEDYEYSSDEEELSASPRWNVMVLRSLGSPSLFLHNDTGFFRIRDQHESPLKDVVVHESESSSMMCAHIDSSSLLQWSSNLASLPFDMREERQLLQNSDNSALIATLDLTNVHRSLDELELTCSTFSKNLDKSFENATLKVKLRVVYPPTFTIERRPHFGLPIVKGMTVALDCSTDIVLDEVHWLKDNAKVVVNASRMLFVRVAEEDQGWYQCVGDNGQEQYASLSYFLRVQDEDENEIDDNIDDNVDYEEYENDEEDKEKSEDSRVDRVLDSLVVETKAKTMVSESKTPSLDVLWSTSSNVSLRVCSNPPIDRLLWFTSIFVLRPGESRDNFKALAGRRSKEEPLCVDFELIIEDDFETEIGVVAQNMHGVAMTDVQLHVDRSGAPAMNKFHYWLLILLNLCLVLLTLSIV